VAIQFTESVTPFGHGIDVFAPSGHRISTASRATGSRLTVGLARAGADAEGTYLVQWSVVAADTHPSRDSFTFSVGRPGPAPAGEVAANEVGGVAPAGLGLQTLARWLHFVGLSLSLGVAACVVILAVPGGVPPTTRRLVAAGIALLVLAEPVQVAAQAASFGNLDAASVAQVTASSFGRVTALRLGAALALWATLPLTRSARRWALGLGVAAVATVIAAADAASTHTVSGELALLAFPVTMIHLLSMALWVGAVVVALENTPNRAAYRARLRPLALAGVVLAIATGAVLAVLHVKAWRDLIGSVYGLTLLAKIALLAIVLGTAIAARRRGKVRPVEAVLLAGVLLVTAFLGTVRPPP
jgi:copper transport protein